MSPRPSDEELQADSEVLNADARDLEARVRSNAELHRAFDAAAELAVDVAKELAPIGLEVGGMLLKSLLLGLAQDAIERRR